MGSFKVLLDAVIQPHLDSIKDGRNAIEDGRTKWYIVEPNSDRVLFKCNVKSVEETARGAKGHSCVGTKLMYAGKDIFDYYYADSETQGRSQFGGVISHTIPRKDHLRISQEAPCKDAFKLWVKSRDSLTAADYAKLDDLAAEFKEWVDKNKDYTFQGDPKSKEYTGRYNSRLFSCGVLPELSHLRRHLESQLEAVIVKSPSFQDQVDGWKAHFAQQEAVAARKAYSLLQVAAARKAYSRKCARKAAAACSLKQLEKDFFSQHGSEDMPFTIKGLRQHHKKSLRA